MTQDPTSAQELYFDLTGYCNITQAELKNLLSKLNFSETLQYVTLPDMSVELDSSKASHRSSPGWRSSKQVGAGRRDLCCIFDGLRKKGVKAINKIVVDDLGSPAHSDEAIEDALRMMDVKFWNWKKTDLCTEVVWEVAPQVCDVHLYWSGNNAVLRGWSEEGGLKKLRELKNVHLHVQQGLESSSRTRRNLEEFLSRMKKLCPEVNIDIEDSNARRELAKAEAAEAKQQTEQPDKHEWIQCMKEFRRFFFDAERNANPQKVSERIGEPIKVALIDDGVDIKDLDYNFIGGQTFSQRDDEQDLFDPYYVSRKGHGTTMAKLIYSMCPRAHFYVLRLEDHESPDGVSRIASKSAAQAIRAAVEKGVHIISMSWNIESPRYGDDRKILDSAVAEAANAGILMFCAASDNGPRERASYPSKATPNIFTIGAATAAGVADPWVGSLTNIDFLLSGINVELRGGLNHDIIQSVSGLSVSTALAAGLAALILYCVQVRVLLAPEHEKQKARHDFQLIKRHDGMMKALKSIGTTEASNYRYIKVWDVFETNMDEMEWREQETWIELIAGTGRTLCKDI